MDVSVWWVIGAAFFGLCAGVLLFSMLSVAAQEEIEALPDTAEPQAQV